jgi:hypothetical protein
MPFLRTRAAKDDAEYNAARDRLGAVYVAHDDRAEMIKIGHSKLPTLRLRQLQTGCSGRLNLILIVAGCADVEKTLHWQFMEWRSHGEWFHDPQCQLSDQIARMVHSKPLGGCDVWEIVPGHWVVRDPSLSRPGWTHAEYVPVVGQ